MIEDKKIGAGAELGALTDPGLLSAMQAMMQVSDFTSASACGPVKAFQSAWNSIAVPQGASPGLTVDGGYGPETANAAGQVAAANGGGNVPAGLTSGWPNCGGGVTPPQPPPAPPVVPSKGWPTWFKVVLWIIALGGVAGLGLWLYKKFGTSSPMAAEPTKRRGKRKAGR